MVTLTFNIPINQLNFMETQLTQIWLKQQQNIFFNNKTLYFPKG